jgi:hypothetical protein
MPSGSIAGSGCVGRCVGCPGGAGQGGAGRVGRPISPHAMTQKLRRHGIAVRAARNGALATLADMLGMHVNTAVRWVILARRDWTDYLADRAEEQRAKSKPEPPAAREPE